ncbi:hypothetical protein HMPREF3167_02500 [Trueperella sp. HMSC08B05]|uniref:hypothetical protein n=1 Tax=Trueperella sp. HMSC08B05 TaxID=1581135 RepID=UPI0008A647C9|nr:hypothetical protein [Trueperella sp. HMSC08B05]OFS75709.1 hypothetical protein HMPREF3167_02500 [Trueperella sp. HMSC08B05]
MNQTTPTLGDYGMDLDPDTLAEFMNSITTAELAVLAADEDDETATLMNIAVISANRLGFGHLTRDDLGNLPVKKLAALIDAAARVNPTTPEVLTPLLERISK